MTTNNIDVKLQSVNITSLSTEKLLGSTSCKYSKLFKPYLYLVADIDNLVETKSPLNKNTGNYSVDVAPSLCQFSNCRVDHKMSISKKI